MNATVCPTITASDAATYGRQIEKVASFATRIHIDLSDGSLAPSVLVRPDEIWWPGGVRADIHVMYKYPLDSIDALVALQPQLIILHAEAAGDFAAFAAVARRHGIETGIALLQTTPVEAIKAGLDFIDHVLVFSGSLGQFGGKANPALMSKVRALKELKPQLEIGWDGGINAQNSPVLARSGVEVLNTGGFIQNADNPESAYNQLVAGLIEPTAPHNQAVTKASNPPLLPTLPSASKVVQQPEPIAPAPAAIPERQGIIATPLRGSRTNTSNALIGRRTVH